MYYRIISFLHVFVLMCVSAREIIFSVIIFKNYHTVYIWLNTDFPYFLVFFYAENFTNIPPKIQWNSGLAHIRVIRVFSMLWGMSCELGRNLCRYELWGWGYANSTVSLWVMSMRALIIMRPLIMQKLITVENPVQY